MHSLISKLGLGAAQFGLDGGASPRRRAPEAEVREMIAIAARNELRIIDVAAASAHGESVLGQVMPRPAPFRIAIKAARGDKGVEFVEAEARAAIKRLDVASVDAIMVQSAGDLFASWGEGFWRCLLNLKEAGLVARVGISAYASDDPAGLARRFKPDIIQVPASLLDQRLLVDGALTSIREAGIEVHLRSIFLNGLLFLPPDRAPSAIGAAALSRLSRARRLIAEGRSDPLQAALGFALSRPEADAVIVGAATATELSAIIAAAAKPPPDLDWDGMALEDPAVLDTRRWAAA